LEKKPVGEREYMHEELRENARLILVAVRAKPLITTTWPRKEGRAAKNASG